MSITPQELNAQGVSCDIPFAAKVLGGSKPHAYALAKADDFPCRIVRVGSRWVVPTAALRTLLGYEDGRVSSAALPNQPANDHVELSDLHREVLVSLLNRVKDSSDSEARNYAEAYAFLVQHPPG